MKIEPLVKKNDGANNSSAPPSSNLGRAREFEHLLEWVRLRSAHIRKNGAGVDKHRQNLRALVKTQKRLSEMDNWRESVAFSEPEKVAMSLSESISLHDPAKELSPLIFEEARRYFSTDEMIRLTIAIMAVNDWIDLRA